MAKKKFQVCVKETLERVVDVKASSEQEALAKVEEMRRNEDIVLTADDFTGYEIFIF